MLNVSTGIRADPGPQTVSHTRDSHKPTVSELCLTQHITGHFGDSLSRQSRALILTTQNKDNTP